MDEIEVGQLRQWSGSGGRELFIVVDAGPTWNGVSTWYILGRHGSQVKFTSRTLLLESEVIDEAG